MHPASVVAVIWRDSSSRVDNEKQNVGVQGQGPRLRKRARQQGSNEKISIDARSEQKGNGGTDLLRASAPIAAQWLGPSNIC
jgi:hypothetical protein